MIFGNRIDARSIEGSNTMMVLYTRFLTRRFAREEGQTMAEYAVILSVISALVIAALLLLGGNITNVINRIADAIS